LTEGSSLEENLERIAGRRGRMYAGEKISLFV
jgi:hypothetical protein